MDIANDNSPQTLAVMNEEPISPPTPTMDDAVLEDEVDQEIARTIPDMFAITSAETATWLVRRVVSARTHAEKVKLWAALELRRAAREEERLLFMFGGQLRAWTEAEVTKLQGRRRSIALPGGTVGFRAVPSRLVVHDEARVMRWARAACSTAIVTSERLLKTPIAQHIERTGEVPEGAEFTPPRDQFFVR